MPNFLDAQLVLDGKRVWTLECFSAGQFLAVISMPPFIEMICNSLSQETINSQLYCWRCSKLFATPQSRLLERLQQTKLRSRFSMKGAVGEVFNRRRSIRQGFQRTERRSRFSSDRAGVTEVLRGRPRNQDCPPPAPPTAQTTSLNQPVPIRQLKNSAWRAVFFYFRTGGVLGRDGTGSERIFNAKNNISVPTFHHWHQFIPDICHVFTQLQFAAKKFYT